MWPPSVHLGQVPEDSVLGSAWPAQGPVPSMEQERKWVLDCRAAEEADLGKIRSAEGRKGQGVCV